MYKKLLLAVAAASMLAMSGCSSDPTLNTAGGAVIGAVAGGAIAGTPGAIGGAIAGGVIGHETTKR